MRVSVFVMFGLLGMAMGQVRFRDSMLGHMIHDTVAGGRDAVGSVVDVFSTIGNGMSKMVGIPASLRRQNKLRKNQPQFRQNNRPRENALPLQPQREAAAVPDYHDDYDVAPARPRPLRRRRPNLRKKQRQQFDPVQRLSGSEINSLAIPRKPNFSLQKPSTWFT